VDISTEVLPHYLDKIYTFQNSVYHRDIGTVESYALAQIYKYTLASERKN